MLQEDFVRHRVLLFSAVIAASLIASATASAGPCVITARRASLKDVRVHAGGKTLTLRLDKVPVALDLQSATVATLRVRAPLRFVAVGHSMSTVTVRVARKLRLYGGRLVVAPRVGTKLKLVRGRRVGVELGITGLKLRRPALVPCRALTVPATSLGTRAAPVSHPGEQDYGHTTGFVPLYRSPGRGTPLWVELNSTPLVAEQRPGWVRLEVVWTDGSALRGWVPAKHVRVSREKLTVGGGVGTGLIGGACGSSHPPRLVPMTLRRNARIAVSPGGAVWARAARQFPVKTFVLSRSDGWLQIARIKHLPTASTCTYHDKMWVHVKDIVWKKNP